MWLYLKSVVCTLIKKRGPHSMLLIREVLKIPVCWDTETRKLINRLRGVQAVCRLYLQISQKYVATSSDHCIWIYKQEEYEYKKKHS
jgi:hypothetical protein